LQSRAPSLGEPPPMEDMWDHSDGTNRVNSEEIMRWILEDNVDNTISQLGRLVGNKMSESRAFNVTSTEEIEEFNKKAESLKNELVSVGVFEDKNLDMNLIEADVTEFKQVGLREMTNRKVRDLRKSNITKIQEDGKEYEQIDTLVDLLENGVKSIMKSSFKPNGGSSFYRQSKSYSQTKLCAISIFLN